ERVGEAHAFYYHCDQIGTPLLMTDELGDVVWEASYKAWGEAREVIARASKAAGITPRNLLRFQGQQVDEETGLHYNRYRYYDPASGRFVSKDPIGLAGGLNAYQYAPNPVKWIDPLGLARFGSGKGTHTAQVTVRKAGGSQRNCGIFQSGNMTPEEKALGFPQNTLATHTEARAVSQVPLEPGDHMIIDGQYPPCTSCKGKMNARAIQSGATIQYNWQEDGQQKTWIANPSKGCR
ncbi:RHS repeat-associated core domain-containing protein, partial [Burkholderia ubonensis]